MKATTFQHNILVAQLGARKHYQEPILFHQWGILNRLYTDFYSGNTPLVKVLRKEKIYQHFPNIIKKSLDRYDPALQTAKVVHFPILSTYASRLKKTNPSERSKIIIDTGKKFCHRIISSGLKDVQIVYGFDGACLELFEYAKNQGIKCILDQTIAERSLIHELLLQEEQLWQGWSKSPFQVYESDLKLVKRQQQEQQLADHIICGSSFVKESLIVKGIEPNKISVVPLGGLQEYQSIKPSNQVVLPCERDDGLRILFAGSVGLRKGIQYLLNALKKIKNEIPFTCKIAGFLDINSEIVDEFKDGCEFLGLVPRSQMRQLYSWADVFVLPSICEGSAMVTYEALSYKLPIITTYNTGSIVRNDIDGFVTEIRDSNVIAEKLIFLYKNRLIDIDNRDHTNYLQQINFDAKNKLKDCIITI